MSEETDNPVKFNWGERSSPRLDSQDPHLRIHSVNVFVRNLEQSLRFYVDQLGFTVAYDAHLPSGERWTAVAPPDGAALLTLITAQEGTEEFSYIGR